MLALLAGCAHEAAAPSRNPALLPATSSSVGEYETSIPMRDESGVPQTLAARICRPASAEGPIAIIMHGAPPQSAAVAGMRPTRCDSPPARWFLARGYGVVFALRRGFGASTGPIAEDSGACDAPDYVRAGRAGARDIAAVVDYVRGAFARRRIVVVGQSTGGWATVAYAASASPEIVALVSMAGGRGGRASDAPRTYCRPERLVEAASVFGQGARVPMLWIVAENDSFFEPALLGAMAAAFNAAGGHARLEVVAPFDDDGHRLFYAEAGPAVWGALVEPFLRAAPEATATHARIAVGR